jgi:hypothetical protein
MAKRGNPGYGKMENIRQNVDKFSPVFWDLMDKFAKSKAKDDQRFFMQEFNNIQTRMIPTELTGEGGGEIKVSIMQYGNSPALQVPAKGIPATTS